MRRWWRWGVALLLVVALVSLPSLIAARPVHAQSVEPAALLARIRASASVPWSGYGESRGGVALPDVKDLGDATSLLGTTTRYRVWWHDGVRHRVDTLSLTGEKDSAEDSTGSWQWDSDAEIALRVVGTPPIRLLQGQDLVAPTLGRRLAGTPDVTLRSVPAQRVAGRSVPGLRLSPKHPGTTTVEYVDLWADPETGLTLRVDVKARGQQVPVMRSLLLDLGTSTPSLADASFAPPDGYSRVTQDDLAGEVNDLSPYVLPAALGGVPRSALVGGADGVATYGAGFGQVLLLPLPRGEGRDLARSLRALGGSFDTPLLKGVLVQGGDFRQRFLLLGTVPFSELTTLSQDLVRNPPPARDGS